MSFRARLLFTSLLVLGVGLGALVVAGNVLLDQQVKAEASSLLRERMDAQLAALSVKGQRVLIRQTPNDARLDKRSWVLERGRVIERPDPVSPGLDRLAVRLGRTGRVAELEDGDDVRLRAQPVRPAGRRVGAVVVALDVEPLETLQTEVLLGSLVIAGLVMFAGGLATRGALRGALHPVAQMTKSAADWSEHDLDHRFALGPARDELTALAATLDGLLERIAASRRHEQRFAAEVAHELRTPLAGLRGRAELALAAEGPAAAAERTEALHGAIAQADRLTGTIDDLMALARRQLDPSGGTTDLASVASEYAEPPVEVRIASDLPLVEGEPEVVRRALAPLLDNARRHARSRVVLEVSADEHRVRLEVRDDGPGINPVGADRLFEPGVRDPGTGSEGAGLGLPLARRLARSCGGDVTVETVHPGGGRFVLDLPAIRSPNT